MLRNEYMKHIYMKIREQFIPLIKSGVKTHEYRLNKPRFQNINVGDILVLISNSNPNNFIKVVVESISHYNNWEDAIKDTWKEDFYGLYSNYDDIIKEGLRYYSKEEIEKYGINVYDIKVYSAKLKSSRFLLDTNIIIERESSNNVSTDVSLVYKAIDKLGGEKFIHEITIEEIKKHKDEKVKNNMLDKLCSYQTLITKKETTYYFEDKCNCSSNDKNSQNDNELLKQVFNGNVDFLLTNDKGIIRKAKDLYLSDKVLTPYSFLNSVDTNYPKLIDYDVLSIKLVKIGTLEINDPFFDTLRKDYGGPKFNQWLNKKSNKEAYVYQKGKDILGFLYLKQEDEDEDYSMFDKPFDPAKRLKIGTFKIQPSASGLRLGERFLKIVFDNALKKKVDEIYVTLFEEKRDEVKLLKSILEEWGFIKKTFIRFSGEAVLVKNMKEYDYNKNPKYNYPLKKANKDYLFLPIAFQYHTRLFPDLYLSNENINFFDEEACGYAIEKIYVSGYPKISAKPGDIVCIYRIGEKEYKKYSSVISGVGILQEIKYPSSEKEFVTECKNKTVFSEKELKEFYIKRKYRTVIKILFLDGFKNKIILKDLWENGIITYGEGARITTPINEVSFQKIVELGEGNL